MKTKRKNPPVDYRENKELETEIFSSQKFSAELKKFFIKSGLAVERKVKEQKIATAHDLEALVTQDLIPALKNAEISRLTDLFRQVINFTDKTLILQLACLLWIAGMSEDACLAPFLKDKNKHIETILKNKELFTYYVMCFATGQRIAYFYEMIGFQLTWSGDFKENPAHWAAYHDNVSASEYFLCTHRDFYFSKDKDGYTVAFWGVQKDSKSTVKVIIEKIPEVLTQRGNRGQTLLHTAAEHDSLSSLKYLIKKDPTLLTEIDIDDFSPLLYAVYHGRILSFQAIAKIDEDEMVIHWQGSEYGENLAHLLIYYHGADSNPPNKLQSRRRELLKYILANYSQLLTMNDNNGDPPITWAIEANSAYLLTLIFDYAPTILWCHPQRKITLFHLAAENGYLDLLNYLIAFIQKNHSSTPYMNFIFNKENQNGHTPLVLAVQNGHPLAIFQAIIAATETIHWRRNSRGNGQINKAVIDPALVEAEGENGENIVHTLIKAYGSDQHGQTAQQKNLEEILKYINIHYPSLLVEQTESGLPPIIYIIRKGAAKLLSIFVKENVTNLHWENPTDGITLAHIAAAYNHPHILSILGASLNIRSASGETPLHYAIKYNAVAVVKYYVEKMPEALQIKTKEKGNLLHYLATPQLYRDYINSSKFFEEYLSPYSLESMRQRIKIIHYLVCKMGDSAFDQYDAEFKTPLRIAQIHCEEWKDSRSVIHPANSIECFLIYTSLKRCTEDRFNLPNLAGAPVLDYFNEAIRNFLPIYWFFLYVPEVFSKNGLGPSIHIILDYAADSPMAIVLAVILKINVDSVKAYLALQSAKFYFTSYCGYLSSQGKQQSSLMNVSPIEMIRTVEHYKFSQLNLLSHEWRQRSKQSSSSATAAHQDSCMIAWKF